MYYCHLDLNKAKQYHFEKMVYKDISCTSIIKKITRKDDLFGGVYTIDPYHNCGFGCVYCDSTFDDIIYIKSNIVDKLEQEFKGLAEGRIIIGSVHDPYQEAEKKYHLTRKILKFLSKYDFPVHILTKSTEVVNDLSILTSFTDVMITFSMLTLNQRLSKKIELYTPSPLDRLRAMEIIHHNGIKTGIALIPIIPYITDRDLKQIIQSAADHHADYILYNHLELKGDQKRIFFNFIQQNFPHLFEKYEMLYNDNYRPSRNYQKTMNSIINDLCRAIDIQTSVIGKNE